MIRKLLMLAPLVAFALVPLVPLGAFLATSTAEAAPQEPGLTVPTADGGNIVTLDKNANYVGQCLSTSCARLYAADKITDGGPSVSCASNDVFRLPSAVAEVGARYEFQTGGLNRIRIVNSDAGAPNCVIWRDTKNP